MNQYIPSLTSSVSAQCSGIYLVLIRIDIDNEYPVAITLYSCINITDIESSTDLKVTKDLRADCSPAICPIFWK